jgi:hypothetical protein
MRRPASELQKVRMDFTRLEKMEERAYPISLETGALP